MLYSAGQMIHQLIKKMISRLTNYTNTAQIYKGTNDKYQISSLLIKIQSGCKLLNYNLYINMNIQAGAEFIESQDSCMLVDGSVLYQTN